VDKIEAARQAKGFIQLQSETSAQIKQAIEAVSAITRTEGNQVEFEGHRIVEGHGFALQINCYDIYRCPRGYLLHTYVENGPNWAVTGHSLPELLAAAPDRRIAKRAHGMLVQKNLLAMGH
jgi:hypothetical protein